MKKKLEKTGMEGPYEERKPRVRVHLSDSGLRTRAVKREAAPEAEKEEEERKERTQTKSR